MWAIMSAKADCGSITAPSSIKIDRFPYCWSVIGSTRVDSIVLSLSLAILLTACGYRSFQPTLPQFATRLWVAPVQNQTFTPELDILLRQQLQRQFSQYPNLQLTSLQASEWSLETTLTKLSFTRLINSDFRRLTYILQGQIALRRPLAKEAAWGPHTIRVIQSSNFAKNQSENPAMIDQVLRQTLQQFAKETETRLLQPIP